LADESGAASRQNRKSPDADETTSAVNSPPRRTSGTGPELDRHADQRAVLGPRSVVVLHVGVAEQLVQGEPGVAGALADPAVRDGRLGLVQAGLLVQLPDLVVGLEGAVLVGRLAPRHVQRCRDVAGALRLLLRQ